MPKKEGRESMVKPALLLENESERIQALNGLHILDTPVEERYERITRLAARLLDIPIVLVNLVDSDVVWFKSCFGADGNSNETSRDDSFCSWTILHDEAMVVPDTLLDPRFKENPYVTGSPHVRF